MPAASMPTYRLAAGSRGRERLDLMRIEDYALIGDLHNTTVSSVR
jgi:hypothetical protein